MVDWTQPLKKSGYPGTTAACYTGESLPTLHYSQPQRIKINTWYQPTGCSRWSYGFFIGTLQMVQAIQNNLSQNSGSPLVMSSTATDPLTIGQMRTSTRTF